MEFTNQTPHTNGFRFERIENGLKKAGRYRLEFTMLPKLPGKGPLTISTELLVTPGPLARLDIQVNSLAWQCPKGVPYICYMQIFISMKCSQ